MKKILLSMLCLLGMAFSAEAQVLDGYNTIFLKSHTNNQWGVDDRIKEAFTNKGFSVVMAESEIPTDRQGRLATLTLTYSFEVKYGGTPFHYDLVNMLGEKVFEAEGMGNTMSAKADVNRACKKALNKMESLEYSFDSSKTPKLPTPETKLATLTDEQMMAVLKDVDEQSIEGVYKNMNEANFKLAILKDGDKYLALVMATDEKNWCHGDVKAVFEHLRGKYYNATYFKKDYQKVESIVQLSEDGILKMGDYSYIKVYPAGK